MKVIIAKNDNHIIGVYFNELKSIEKMKEEIIQYIFNNSKFKINFNESLETILNKAKENNLNISITNHFVK